jgi:hypothetical protein
LQAEKLLSALVSVSGTNISNTNAKVSVKAKWRELKTNDMKSKS